jgi:hypothetical protein
MSKPHALQLSEALYAAPETGAFPEDIEAAADELRRLHEVNQAMLEVLKEIVEMWDAFVPTELTAEPHLKARAAIAKGEQS